jgi:transposase InsO family protein
MRLTTSVLNKPEYIEVFDNRRRRHSAAGYLSPAEYEEKFKSTAWGVEA